MIVRKLDDGCGVIKADFPAQSRWGVKPSAGYGTALKGPDWLLLPLEGSPGRGSQLPFALMGQREAGCSRSHC